MMIASAVLGPHKMTKVKQMPYESGMNPFGDARQRFDVRYLSDGDRLSCCSTSSSCSSIRGPWRSGAAVRRPTLSASRARGRTAGIPAGISFPGFLGNPVFIVILAAAFAYAWQKGVFEWR